MELCESLLHKSYNNCLIGATLKFLTFSNFATKLRLFGASDTKNNFIFELGMLENIFPDVLGIKVAKNVKKFENMKYRIRLRVYSKTLDWPLRTTPNTRTKCQLRENFISGDMSVTNDARTHRYEF